MSIAPSAPPQYDGCLLGLFFKRVGKIVDHRNWDPSLIRIRVRRTRENFSHHKTSLYYSWVFATQPLETYFGTVVTIIETLVPMRP